MQLKNIFRGIGSLFYCTMPSTQAFLSSTISHARSCTGTSCYSTFSNLIPNEETKKFQPILISIEGNIGAGKTTILSKLKANNPEWTFIDEPVDLWTNLRTDKGDSLLEVFYMDRKRWSYTFQNCALLTRYQMIENSIQKIRDHGTYTYPCHVFLTERCLDTDHQVFTKMLRADGSIDGLELHLYEKLLSHLKRSATPVSAIVHVDTPPSLCYERIKIRARDGENNIPLSYLEALDRYQCAWVDHAGIPLIKTEENGYEKVEEFIQGLQYHAGTVHHQPLNKISSSATASTISSSIRSEAF